MFFSLDGFQDVFLTMYVVDLIKGLLPLPVSTHVFCILEVSILNIKINVMWNSYISALGAFSFQHNWNFDIPWWLYYNLIFYILTRSVQHLFEESRKNLAVFIYQTCVAKTPLPSSIPVRMGFKPMTFCLWAVFATD